MPATEMLPVLFLCVLLFRWSAGISGNDPEFLTHLKRVRGFSCRHPRMTAVKTLTFIKDAGVSKHYIPESTVLHRCDAGSGCCTDARLSCGPLNEETVELKFLVTDMVDKANSGYQIIKAINHTRCGCMVNDGPRRSMTGGSSKCDRLSLLQTLVIFSVILWKLSF